MNAGMAALDRLHARIAANERRRAQARLGQLRAELAELRARETACTAELARLEARHD